MQIAREMDLEDAVLAGHSQQRDRFDRSYDYRAARRIWSYPRPGAVPPETWDPGERGGRTSRVDPMEKEELNKPTIKESIWVIAGEYSCARVHLAEFCFRRISDRLPA